MPEGDYKVPEGFWFLGKLSLKTGGIYHTTMQMTGSMSFVTKVELMPIKYGPQVEENGKMVREWVSLFLYNRRDQTDVGPVLEVTFSGTGASQRIVGYLQTVGLEKAFIMTSTQNRKRVSYRVELEGNIYNEVPESTVTLTAEGVGLPHNMPVQVSTAVTYLRLPLGI